MSKKSNSVLDKLIPLGTIQRRQRQKQEIEDMKTEGINAIQALYGLTLDPETYELKENEERSALEISEKKKLEPIMKVFIDWINGELADKRVIVKDLQEDLYDGQILQMIIEKLSGLKLSADSKLNLGEISQKQNLKLILDFINGIVDIHPMMSKWRVENIYDKDLIAILHLLVAIVRYFKVPINLPENLSVKLIIIQKKKKLEKITVIEQITGNYTNGALNRKDRDAFDTLFDHAPEKLILVKNSLLTFLHKHLEKIKIKITDLDSQLSDGVNLILLMGVLENYFIPEYAYHPVPINNQQKIANCKYLFELLDDAGIQQPNCNPEEIANGDLKSLLRILYLLFSNYKDRD